MNYRVIKENDLFLLTDEMGDIPEGHTYGAGLYTKDTRFLSKWHLTINGHKPVLLSSEAEKNYKSEILLTNPHIEKNGTVELWRESVEIKRKRFIYDNVFYEILTIKSYSPSALDFRMGYEFDADFKDMFIVRGFQNGKTGRGTNIEKTNNSFTYHYTGSDEIQRSSHISWDTEAEEVKVGAISFSLSLQHEEEKQIAVTIQPLVEQEAKDIKPADQALHALETSYKEWTKNTTNVNTNHKGLQRLVDRGIGDLRSLLTDVGYGLFPVAGLPWFGVPFGRDSLIAAQQLLPFNPEVAKGTLRTMAAFQGTKEDPWRDEQPGKIMHELRSGELANTNQIPFTPYYGTIDATPLYLVLFTEYINWTGDLHLFEELKESVENALYWINHYGDQDGDLFIEYHQESSKGIANQGWKDSGDSIVHRDGTFAETPIALAEVQGYVYQAKQGLSTVYKKTGNLEKAKQLSKEAMELAEKFEQAYWMEDVSFYALALDKNKNQVGTITSNPGHVLYADMLSPERANQIGSMLISEKMFSGYGIRTMGEKEAGYNPISYHNGTIWPHDNSLIVLGLSKTNQKIEAAKAMTGMIKSASSFEYDRLPELFCGYSSNNGKAIKYPVACSPQAWAAGTPLLFVQAMAGIFPDVLNEQIFVDPVLPEGVEELEIANMKIGQGVIHLQVKQNSVTVIHNSTGCEVIEKALLRK
ncbi:glycogen debranching N-terminal domain-containing protein [Alteribacillus sp. JSM 102045]|uniref:amylo-alpha-1,6-glucosidase n=1 Tax=Alteribacillus sp. JSM 102045 TaxID=1562101 RepID=UPI0035C0BA21